MFSLFNKNNKDYKVKLVDYKAGQILTGNITEDMVSISSKINNNSFEKEFDKEINREKSRGMRR